MFKNTQSSKHSQIAENYFKRRSKVQYINRKLTAEMEGLKRGFTCKNLFKDKK